jgi:succinyl-diaminopimelate desuccinylase
MSDSGNSPCEKEDKELDLLKRVVPAIAKLVGIETWRNSDRSNEAEVQQRLTSIKQFFDNKVACFNEKPDQPQVNCYEWKSQDGNYRVFRYRAGVQKPTAATRKICLICHLDTVPPGNNDWAPFTLRQETRIYHGAPTPFLIGRGAIDDKGPAVIAFDAFLSALGGIDGKRLENLTIDVLLDTSEETDMSTPQYLKTLGSDEQPDLGVVFDAFWAVRAEKGLERPVFTLRRAAIPPAPDGARYLASIKTADGSTNMIPAFAQATISGNEAELDEFAKQVAGWYRNCPFDDAQYHRAELRITRENDAVVLTTLVAGAQHGSAPDRNRAEGANPLVSLANFLAYLIERGLLANSTYGEMCRFIRWAFGTRVFGENHPDLLSRYDEVFQEGNGTTYALTQLGTNNDQVELKLDIRYALGHHSRGWDGSEGTVPGVSLFKPIFDELVKRYEASGGAAVGCDTKTIENFGPDIRSPNNENLSRLAMAYRRVLGDNCPLRAIGGGTDAHGNPRLVVAGALFTDDLGPPINYHGLDEGAPLIDLENSHKILVEWLRQEIGAPAATETGHLHQGHTCCVR